jgi:hypothetical protein
VLLSRTLTVKVDVPAAFGFPVSCPRVDNDNPAGSEPDSKPQLYGPIPPAASRFRAYAVPVMPVGRDAGVEMMRGRTIASVKSFCTSIAGLELSLTLSVKLAIPPVVGVPLRTPAADKVNPSGKVPDTTDHVSGAVPPDAVRVWLYGVLTRLVGRGDVLLIVTGVTVVSASCFVAVSAGELLSLTRTVKFELPVPVGVPLRTPAPDSDSPPGGEPDVTVHV